MPKLESHIARLVLARSHDAVELARLQLIYDRARENLSINPTDPARERLALLVLQISDAGADPEELLSQVTALYRHWVPARWGRIAVVSGPERTVGVRGMAFTTAYFVDIYESHIDPRCHLSKDMGIRMFGLLRDDS